MRSVVLPLAAAGWVLLGPAQLRAVEASAVPTETEVAAETQAEPATEATSADGADTQPTEAAEAPSPEQPPEVGHRVVVPPLEAQGVAENLANNLSGVVLLRLQEVPDLDVIGHRDIERMLDEVQRKQLMGCGDDEACMANIAGTLDAGHVVWGSVGKVGERFLINLALMDLNESRVLRRTQREVTDVDHLVAATSEATDALWLDPELPSEGCYDCGAEPTSASVALKLGNNFMSFFQSGVDVSLLAPSLDLDIGYRFGDSIVGFLGIGMSLGNSESRTDDVSFQVVPVNLGARYHSQPLVGDLTAFGGIAIGVGFVRTVIAGDAKVGPAFSAKVLGGVAYRVAGNFGVLFEAGYQMTTNTPDDIQKNPLNAAALKLGISYGF